MNVRYPKSILSTMPELWRFGLVAACVALWPAWGEAAPDLKVLEKQALEKPSEELLLKLGAAYDGKRDYAKAIACYRKLVKLSPKAEHYNKLIYASRCARKFDLQTQIYLEYFEKHPDRKARQLPALIQAYRDNKQTDKALEAAREYVELAPKTGTAHATLARMLADAGKKDEALELYRKAVEIRKPRSGAEGWQVALARLLLDAKKYDEAKETLEDALTRPGQLGYMLQGTIKLHLEVLKKKGELEAYVKSLEKEAAEKPVEPLLSRLGLVYQQLNDHEKGAAVYRQLVDLKPDARQYTQLIYALERASAYDKQIEAYLEFFEKLPDQRENGLYGLMQAYHKTEQFDKAVQTGVEAVAALSKNPKKRYYQLRRCYTQLAAMYKDKKEYEKAIEAYTSLREISLDRGKDTAVRSIAEVYTEMGDPAAELTYLISVKGTIKDRWTKEWAERRRKELLRDPQILTLMVERIENKQEKTPDDIGFLVRAAKTYEEQENPEKCLDVLKKVVSLDPSVEHYALLLEKLREAKAYKELIDAYRALFKSHPEEKTGRLASYLGALNLAGETKPAIEEWLSYAKKFPKDPRPWIELASLYVTERKVKKALSSCDKAIEFAITPEAKQLYRVKMAAILPRAGKTDKALALTRSMLTDGASGAVRREAHAVLAEILKSTDVLNNNIKTAGLKEGPVATYFPAGSLSVLNTLFDFSKNLASKGKVTASGHDGDHEAGHILSKDRNKSWWRADDDHGWLRVDWDPPVRGRFLALVSQPGQEKNGELGESIVSLNGKEIALLESKFSSGGVAVLDFSESVDIPDITIHVSGKGQPGLASLELYLSTTQPKGSVVDTVKPTVVWFIYEKGFVIREENGVKEDNESFVQTMGLGGIKVNGLAFTEDHVWAATSKGAFRYTRNSKTWVEYAVNAEYFGWPIDGIEKDDDGRLVFIMSIRGRSKAFILHPETRQWMEEE